MGLPMGLAGNTIVTADTVIGVSGRPVRVFSATYLSSGTAAALVLRNGTGAGDDALVQTADGTINVSITLNFGESGLLFPAGCFVDFDSDMTRISIMAQAEV